MAERLAPPAAAEGTHPGERGVEIGDAQAEPLEPRVEQPGGRRARGWRFVPFEEIDRTTVVAARPEQDRRVPPGASEPERRAGLRLGGSGVRADLETEPFGVEASRPFEIRAVHVDVKEAGVAQRHADTVSARGPSARGRQGWSTERISWTG